MINSLSYVRIKGQVLRRWCNGCLLMLVLLLRLGGRLILILPGLSRISSFRIPAKSQKLKSQISNRTSRKLKLTQSLEEFGRIQKQCLEGAAQVMKRDPLQHKPCLDTHRHRSRAFLGLCLTTDSKWLKITFKLIESSSKFNSNFLTCIGKVVFL